MTKYFRQSTASQEVTLGPFVDSTDANTEETGLTINAADVLLHKHGGTTLPAKNSGGGTHISNGIYSIVLDATDTNTIGNLDIYCHISGALWVKVPCVVLDEAVYDALFGTVALATATNITGGTITTVTTLTNLPAITAGWLTAAGIAAGALNGKGDWNIGKTGYALSAAGVQAIWDALTSALTTVGSIGKLLVDNINATISSRSSHSAADVWASVARTLTAATNITSTGGTTVPQTGDSFALANGVNGFVATKADTAAIKLKTDNLPSDPADQSLIIAATSTILADTNAILVDTGTTLDGKIDVIDGIVDAIKAKTDSLTFTVAGNVDANIQRVNDVVVTGTGAVGDEWGP